MKDEKWAGCPMVEWYDPIQLAKTGARVAQAGLFAESADPRALQTLFCVDGGLYDESEDHEQNDREELVLDYISDVGDGFDPTYAVIHAATQPSLEGSVDGREEVLPRASVVLLGGDLVYPEPSSNAYVNRFVIPYSLASLALRDGPPTNLYAIPGNHDWYDNLVGFTQLFLRRRSVGEFHSKQGRSYFALKLLHDWWAIATDVQLGSDVDEAQVAYFDALIEKLAREEAAHGRTQKLLLFHAEPHWVFDNDAVQCGRKPSSRGRRLTALERRLDGPPGKRRVRAMFAGDLHHYRRHEGAPRWRTNDEGKVTLITAGGGGAFLHPTHSWRDGKDAKEVAVELRAHEQFRDFDAKHSYPDAKVSRKLASPLTWFPIANPRFLIASAVGYGLIGANLLFATRTLCHTEPTRCREMVFSALFTPNVVMFFSVVVAGFYLFTDTSSKRYKAIAGTLHGLAHALLALALPALYVVVRGEDGLAIGATSVGPWLLDVLLFIVGLAVVVAAGALVGSLLMGFYLRLSLGLKRHRNEAFSGLKIPDYKSFLRLRFRKDGSVGVHVFGIDRVPRKWKNMPTAEQAEALSFPLDESETLHLERPEPDEPLEVRQVDAFVLPAR